jgi:hypothetical protein
MVYVVIGLAFFSSPINVFKLFVVTQKQEVAAGTEQSAEEINPAIDQSDSGAAFAENWLNQIMNDEILAPLYFMFRIFSALLLTSGLAMIMPLFDPLKYRGIIHFNGVVFPFLAVILSIANVISLKMEAKGSFFSILASSKYHLLIVVMGILFAVVFLLTMIGLMITKKQADDGKE